MLNIVGLGGTSVVIGSEYGIKVILPPSPSLTIDTLTRCQGLIEPTELERV
jgi:hypothetical protein